MRKLASVQVVHKVEEIVGCDNIEKISVLGWQCISKKNEFKKGNLCVYFEVDSFLPVEDKYEFLRKTSYKSNNLMGEGFRLKTMRFRGELSQGLALPITILPKGDYEKGEDVTKILNVKKWEAEELITNQGTTLREMPSFIFKTDEQRIQSAPELLNSIKGKPYYITTKLDGTSVTYYFNNNEFGVCGRNYEYMKDENCYFYIYAVRNKIEENLKSLGYNVYIQGEFCGGKIQGNKLKLLSPNYYIFNIYNLDEKRFLNFHELIDVTKKLNMETVPVEETGDSFEYNTTEELLERAKGNYTSR